MQTQYTLVFGVKTKEFHVLAPLIAKTLEIEWVIHESVASGVYYVYGDLENEHFYLTRNYDFWADEISEIQYKDFPILCGVSNTIRPDEIEERLAKIAKEVDSIQLLKRKEQDSLL